MTITLERYAYVGIDVSKDKFDVGIFGQKVTTEVASTKRGISDLVRQRRQLDPKMIVVEATGYLTMEEERRSE